MSVPVTGQSFAVIPIKAVFVVVVSPIDVFGHLRPTVEGSAVGTAKMVILENEIPTAETVPADQVGVRKPIVRELAPDRSEFKDTSRGRIDIATDHTDKFAV